MNAKLLDHRYGKSLIRVLKVLRDGDTHTLKELSVAVSLEGDFESSYTSGDNRQVVATDTMKNTVNVLAQQHLGAETERFALRLARHFTGQYPQIRRATIEAEERVWERLHIAGKPHPHSFSQAQVARPFTRVSVDGAGQSVESGVKDLLILKSAASSFAGYPRCEFTTLPETQDRIFATSLTATWTYADEPPDYAASNAAIIAAMLQPFAENDSPSVQTTLFEMGGAALAACPGISQIRLVMPNKHCLRIDLAPFGIENRNELFVPTDEPFGLIEATIGRV